MQRTIYVSPDGAEWWSGMRETPTADGMDGPINNLRTAAQVARQWHRNGLSDGPVIIWVADGVYPIKFPLEFGPEDYGAFEIKAMPGANPVIDGGERVFGWEPTTVHGREAWVADVAPLLLEFGPFRSLFVNGERRRRARYPSEGYLWIEEAPDHRFEEESKSGNSDLLRGAFRFRAAAGDLDDIASWNGADVVMLNRWINERMPVAAYDPETRLVTMKTRTRLFLRTEYAERDKTIRYWIDNVREGLIEPGDWYLDVEERRLYYLPMAGETPEACEVAVPVVKQFVRVRGDLDALRPAGGIRFEGLTFRYADWDEASTRALWWDPYSPPAAWRPRDSYRAFAETNSADPRLEAGSSEQAAFHLPGAIHLECARDLTIANCTIEHVGFYGIGAGEACANLRFVGNTIRDMGGGGILLDGADVHGDPRRITGHSRITDNCIHGGGQVYLAACGITLVHTAQCLLAHNHIHDMTYSGISVGWIWGLTDSVSQRHWIFKNHIHDLGRRGGMSDMGGIYLLGPQPGTFVENNYIHNVQSAAYGGWGIYPDEGSSMLTIEKNVIVHTGSESLHEHMGRQNVIRNNLFLLGGEGGVRFSRGERNRFYAFPTEGGLFFNNIVVTDGSPSVRDMTLYQRRNPYRFEMNLYWNRNGEAACSVFRGPRPSAPSWKPESFEERRESGLDRSSRIADPGLQDLEAGDFSLAPDSPARELGFEPIDLSDVGPRPPEHRIIRHEAEPFDRI
jgi:hypothetical protein